MERLLDTVDQVLKVKQSQVFSLTPDATVYTALELMAQEGIGSVLIMDARRLVGILSERDYARKIMLQGRRSKETKVSEVMTAPVITVGPGATVDECLKLMTVRRFRHLPVIEAGAVRGIVSIGDLVKWIITSQEKTIRQLEDYIAGQYPA